MRDYEVWHALGLALPVKFILTVKAWWQGLNNREKHTHSESWTSLHLTIARQWMNREWIAHQKVQAEKIRFQSEGHACESAMSYYYCKLQALCVAVPDISEETLLHEILTNVPQSWGKYFNAEDVSTLKGLRQAIQANKHLFHKETERDAKINTILERYTKSRDDH